ncbi:MAG: two-component system LytT family response regulator [Candidatus Paceibacteria bacterium]|jgi:two-component system LytT family response regulator
MDSTQIFRVAFADDEPMGRISVRVLLERDPEVKIVAECSNGMQAVEAVRALSPNILFLDIQMPGMGGFDVLAELEDDELPVIVFATAFDRYAVQAFDKCAVDYLLKPFDDERFARALERAKERARQNTDKNAVGGEIVASYGSTIEVQQAEEGGPVSRLKIQREGRIDYVNASDILWIEAADQYVEIHTPEGDFLMRESMGRLERWLDPKRFQRIHRSALVATSEIRALERQAGGSGRVQVSAEKWLPVSRSRYGVVKASLR